MAWHHGSSSTTAPRIPPSNSFRGGECPSPVDASHPRTLQHAPSPMNLFCLSLFAFCATGRSKRNKRNISHLPLAKMGLTVGGLASNPSARLTRQKSTRAERRVTCGRVAISSSADSRRVTGHGDTRTRECDHLKLDRSLVKRPLHLYLAEPPSFTPVETPIEGVPQPVADFNFW
jgi:hypothetical protein